MAQQTQFKKLKEQIEAAKRNLTEMSDAGIDEDPASAFSCSASPEIVGLKQTKMKPGEITPSSSNNTPVINVVSKTAFGDTPTNDHTLGDATEAMAHEFQFFHRKKRLKSSGGLALGASLDEADNAESEALLFEQLGRRLDILEGDVEQNRKYIQELIGLLSSLNLRQKPISGKLKPTQRLNRRHIFWLVVGFLAVGWFGLTPSGHVAIRHFLTFI